MSEHTRRVLLRAISVIDAYEGHNVGLRYLVDSLEGSLKAIEERLPSSFYVRWNDHWGELEQVLATESENAHRKEIELATGALKTLINDSISSTEGEKT